MLYSNRYLAAQFPASRVVARAAEECTLATGDDPVAPARGRLRNQRRRAGVADLGAAHGGRLVTNVVGKRIKLKETGG